MPIWLEKSGAIEKLKTNSIIADVGCGQGESSCVLASIFPDSKVVAVDYHRPSIDKVKPEIMTMFLLLSLVTNFKSRDYCIIVASPFIP